MAITDRNPAAVRDDEVDAPSHPEATVDDPARSGAPETEAVRTEPSPPNETAGAGTARVAFPLSGPARVLLASLSCAAGAIHLVMVPSHAADWTAEGIAFALVGLFQIGMAVALVARPSNLALRLSCLANAVFIGVWVLSRVAGLPVGPHAGVAHAASFVDVTAVVLEALLVIVGYELLIRPERGAQLRGSSRVVLSVVPLAVVVLATAAIASPSTTDHAHQAGGAGGAMADHHAAGGAGMDHAGMDHAGMDHAGMDPGGSNQAANHDDHGGAAHDHGAAGAGAAPSDDKGLSKIMNGQGEGGGHSHEVAEVKLDAPTQQALDGQLDQTRTLIAKYPTVKDAEAAGWHRAGPYSPGLGAHYTPTKFKMNADGKIDPEDIDSPTLIYDGIEADSKLAGFMYQIYSLDTVNAPEGFAGGNDQWHYHTNVCIVVRPGGGIDAPLGADTSAPKELCDKYGGTLIANTGYMVHVWTVPGYESSQGVFSNVNPALTCADGTYHIVDLDEIGTRTTACVDGSTGGNRT